MFAESAVNNFGQPSKVNIIDSVEVVVIIISYEICRILINQHNGSHFLIVKIRNNVS